MCKISFTGGEGGVHPLCRGPCVGRVHPHIGKRAVPSRSCMAVRSCSVSPLRWGGTAFRRTDASIEVSQIACVLPALDCWISCQSPRSPAALPSKLWRHHCCTNAHNTNSARRTMGLIASDMVMCPSFDNRRIAKGRCALDGKSVGSLPLRLQDIL